MKKAILTLALLFTGMNASAWVETAPAQKDYVFKFQLKGQTLEIRRPAASYEDAFDKAADACFKHFKNQHGGRLSEDEGLDIIDVCANPRS